MEPLGIISHKEWVVNSLNKIVSLFPTGESRLPFVGSKYRNPERREDDRCWSGIQVTVRVGNSQLCQLAETMNVNPKTDVRSFRALTLLRVPDIPPLCMAQVLHTAVDSEHAIWQVLANLLFGTDTPELFRRRWLSEFCCHRAKKSHSSQVGMPLQRDELLTRCRVPDLCRLVITRGHNLAAIR